ncbi:MAG: TIM barrel protein [Candidatus Micrarchaeota archaeon]|nr:TIM barrel protein [Candidatus Micrarchaeota archaeon]
MKIRFGTAGIPRSCDGGSIEGIQCVHDLGLSAFEFELVRGAKMGLDLARQCGEKARAADVSLSAHAPYYVNLVSEDAEKARASGERIIQTARISSAAGGGRVVFHPGYYGKKDAATAYNEMSKRFGELVEKIRVEKLNAVLAPETTGGIAEFGSLDELARLCHEFGTDAVNLTIDFAHVHCREGKGWIKSKDDYLKIFDSLEKQLGKRAVQSFHSHFTGVKFTGRGEKNHLTIDSQSPPFKPLAEVLAENGYAGTIISESPNIEADALAMKKAYEKALGK